MTTLEVSLPFANQDVRDVEVEYRSHPDDQTAQALAHLYTLNGNALVESGHIERGEELLGYALLLAEKHGIDLS